jgi:hypothetical protein
VTVEKARGLQNVLFGAEYRVLPHVARGLAYSRFVVNLDRVGDATTLTLNTGWNGGMLYGALYF